MPQKTGITILSFVPLQRKTLFIWQIKVAKTAKAKLCATGKALCINTVFIPGIRYKPDSAVLAQDTCTKIGYFGAKPKLCATKNRHNYPKNSAQAEFLCFCAFAKKNAVSLTNQGCKGCQSEALCPVNTSLQFPKYGFSGLLIYGSQPLHNTKLLQC